MGGSSPLPSPPILSRPTTTVNSFSLGQPASQSAATQTSSSSSDADKAELRRLRESIDAIERRTVTGLATLAGGLLVLGLVLKFWGYPAFRVWILSQAEHEIRNAADTALREALPGVLETVQQKAEHEVLRLARLLALKSQGAFDDALRDSGWVESVTALRNEPLTIRRLIIECLRSTRTETKKNRRFAWEAAQELLMDDSTFETVRLYLDLAVTVRNYNDGLRVFELHRERLLADDDCVLKAGTLLRKLGRSKEARDLLQPLAERPLLIAVASIGALDRDLGRFDACHDSLHAHVLGFLSSPPVKYSKGWSHLLNTFIANCADRGFPADGVNAALYLLRAAPGPVEVFTAGRLFSLLPETFKDKPFLIDTFRVAASQLPQSEAQLRSRILLMELDGDPVGAIHLLRDALVDDANKPTDVYFHRCSLGRLLISVGDGRGAVQALLPATSLSGNGEAEYVIALAYAAEQNGYESALWLEQASSRQPRWTALARNDADLKYIPEVAEFLKRHGNDT